MEDQNGDNIYEEIKNFDELNKYKLSKLNISSQSKIGNKQNSISSPNSNFSLNSFNNSINKKANIKSFNSPVSESSKADNVINKKFVNSKTNVNLKNTMESLNSDNKSSYKKK